VETPAGTAVEGMVVSPDHSAHDIFIPFSIDILHRSCGVAELKIPDELFQLMEMLEIGRKLSASETKR
jgi:hypothetical protein